jgi:hypothetical protein
MDDGASKPSKAEGQGPTETLHDGNTQVQVTSDANAHLRDKVPVAMRQNIANAMKQQSGSYPPCLNPSCRSYGKSHPNCLCYSPGGEAEQQEKTMLGFAHGGAVHHCSCNRPHMQGCEYYADGGEVEDNNEFANNPPLAVDHAIASHGLLHGLTKTGNSKSEDPDRIHTDFIGHSLSGKQSLQNHANNIINPSADPIESDDTDELQSQIDDINQNPNKLMDIGGGLGDRFPAHKAQLLAKSNVAVQYLNSIKPMNSQGGPLDPVMPPSKMQESMYKRQLRIAQKPSLVYQHAKDGTLIPQDLQTIQTIYPDLAKSLVQTATNTLIEAKSSGKKLTYRQRRGLSALMGEPLSYIQTPGAIMAIMQANSGPQQQPQPQGKPKSNKASGAELKQINMVNSQSETPLQSRLADKKE